MVAINNLLIIIVAFCLNIGTADNQKKLYLTVYYESKCPDSKYFIINQLLPTMNVLQSHISLKLVPFGKASSKNGKEFKCQHGPPECLGNIIQDCALDLIQSRSDAEKLDYVACEMDTYAAAKGDFQCVERHNIPAHVVAQCAISSHGITLQLASERLTKSVRPKFIPTITVNGVFDQRIQDKAQENLIGTLCSLLKGASACDNYYNNAVLRYY